MNAARAWFLVTALACIAVVVVHLRTEQTRSVARVLKLESQWVELRRERWDLQARSARLRSPERIHDRLQALRIPLIAPTTDEPRSPTMHLVSGLRQR